MITGDKDVLVPTKMTDDLFRAAVAPLKELWVIPGGEHNNTFMKAGSEYTQRLRRFMSSCLGESSQLTMVEERSPEEVQKLIKDEEVKIQTSEMK